MVRHGAWDLGLGYQELGSGVAYCWTWRKGSSSFIEDIILPTWSFCARWSGGWLHLYSQGCFLVMVFDLLHGLLYNKCSKILKQTTMDLLVEAVRLALG